MKTQVKFYKDPQGDIFAYFPKMNYDAAGIFKMSYAHIGQHSACHPNYIKECAEAAIIEYADLLNELKEYGYDDLIVLNSNHLNAAINTL